jgi:hypothetical protein
VDYDFEGKDLKRRVVVNALITPQEEFAVRLNWSGTYTDGTKFKAVADAEIRLYENNAEVINCPADREGITATDFVPTAGRHYRLVVTVPNYGELSAETDIPQAPAGSLVFARQKGWYRHFDMTELTVPDDTKSVWIRGKRRYNGWKDVFEYYTTSAFVDQINGSNDASEANDKGSTVNFEQFLRIPYENCEAVVPLRFSVFGAEDEKHIFQVITASDTYDRYMKSRYKQELNTEWGGEENPFVEQITVYTNISNGLGIFAGYNYYKTLEI